MNTNDTKTTEIEKLPELENILRKQLNAVKKLEAVFNSLEYRLNSVCDLPEDSIGIKPTIPLDDDRYSFKYYLTNFDAVCTMLYDLIDRIDNLLGRLEI